MSLLLAFAAGAGAGVPREVVSRGGRSWRIRPSYKSLCSKFCAREKQPPAVRGRTARRRRCGLCGRGSGGDVLVEGLACVLHGDRVAEVLAWARGARVRVVGPPSCALRTGFDRLRANGGGERACGRVAGGCFGNGFIAGLAQFSYKSKNFFAEGKQPPLMLAKPHLTIDADYATNNQAGAPDGMGTRAVLVAVSDCVFHGERVAGVLAWALGARVRVGGVRNFPLAQETSNPNFCIIWEWARRSADSRRIRIQYSRWRAFSVLGKPRFTARFVGR